MSSRSTSALVRPISRSMWSSNLTTRRPAAPLPSTRRRTYRSVEQRSQGALAGTAERLVWRVAKSKAPRPASGFRAALQIPHGRDRLVSASEFTRKGWLCQTAPNPFGGPTPLLALGRLSYVVSAASCRSWLIATINSILASSGGCRTLVTAPRRECVPTRLRSTSLQSARPGRLPRRSRPTR